jgi:hypothetical protein
VSNYEILGNERKGYVLFHKTDVSKIVNHCPCCDKPISTQRMAEILAENLTAEEGPTS